MEDYEELMLQISDVMREANRVIPDLSHEQAIKNIRGIVERHGKWIIDGHHIRCNRCNEYICNTDREGNEIPDNFCPNCGAKMEK